MICYSCNCTSFIFTYIVLALLVCYLVIKWKFSYWKNSGVLSTSPRNLFGDLRHVGSKYHFVHKIQDLYEVSKQKSRYYGIYSFETPVLLLTDLDLVKSVLENETTFPYGDKFESWNKFSDLPQKIRNTLNKIIEHSPQIIQHVPVKQSFDVKKTVNQLFFEIVLPLLLGSDDKKLLKALENSSQTCSTFPLLSRLLFNSKSIFKNNFKIPESVRKSLSELIQARQERDVRENDLIDLAVQLQMISTDNKDAETQFLSLFVSEILHSVTTVAFAVYELARHAREQTRLRNELKTIKKLTVETLDKLEYLDQTINETIRLYPLVPTIQRQKAKSFSIPHSDLTLPKYTRIWIPVYAIHRDPRFYRSPNDFNPNNFMEEVVEARPKNAFLPLTENNSVITESVRILNKILIAMLVRNFVFRIDWEKTKDRLEFNKNNLNLDVKDEIWIEAGQVNE